MSSLHDLIDRNFSQPDYGRLLHHLDRNNPKILHYSVQLNDRESLAWEPIHGDRQKDLGRLAIWPIDWHRFQPAQWVTHLPKTQIQAAMHGSIDRFHEQWQYELFRFNCEHWARLVTTGDCCCYQIKEFKHWQRVPILGNIVVGIAGIVTGAWEQNGYAQSSIEWGNS
jgi:hypothetical protein